MFGIVLCDHLEAVASEIRVHDLLNTSLLVQQDTFEYRIYSRGRWNQFKFLKCLEIIIICSLLIRLLDKYPCLVAFVWTSRGLSQLDFRFFPIDLFGLILVLLLIRSRFWQDSIFSHLIPDIGLWLCPCCYCNLKCNMRRGNGIEFIARDWYGCSLHKTVFRCIIWYTLVTYITR